MKSSPGKDMRLIALFEGEQLALMMKPKDIPEMTAATVRKTSKFSLFRNQSRN